MITKHVRALPAKRFNIVLVVVALVSAFATFAVAHLAGLDHGSATSLAGVGASVCCGALSRLRSTLPDDPEWLRFWAPVGEAIAITASICRFIAESSLVPAWVRGVAVVGFYVLPIVVAIIVGRRRLVVVSAARRTAIEARFRRNVIDVRPQFLRNLLIGAALAVGLLLVIAMLP